MLQLSPLYTLSLIEDKQVGAKREAQQIIAPGWANTGVGRGRLWRVDHVLPLMKLTPLMFGHGHTADWGKLVLALGQHTITKRGYVIHKTHY